MGSRQLLFNDFDILSVMENQKAGLTKKVLSAPESLVSEPDEEVIANFVKEFDLDVPELHDADMSMTEREVEVDVSHDYRRAFSRPGPFYMKGTEITVHIPFTGDPILFRVQPSTYTLSPPTGEIAGQDLLLRFQFPNDTPPPNLKADLDRILGDVKNYLRNLSASKDVLHAQLEGEAKSAWNRRKEEFVTRSQVIGGLGLPRREAKAATPAQAVENPLPRRKQAPSPPRDKKPQAKWKVFISHATEDKQAIARALADALIESGLSVWYDDYTLTVGDSLRQKIDEGLSKSEFGIVILSKAFFAKHWPQQELNGLAARETNGKKVILPVWHDISKDEVAAESPILADRLGVPTSLGLEMVVARLIEAMNR